MRNTNDFIKFMLINLEKLIICFSFQRKSFTEKDSLRHCDIRMNIYNNMPHKKMGVRVSVC